MKERLNLLSFTALLLVSLAALPAQEPEKTPPEKEKVSLIALSGTYADLPEAGLSLTGLMTGGATPKAFHPIVEGLRSIAGKPGPGWVLFDLSQPLTLNLAHLAELDRCVAELRRSGKKVCAYLETAGRSHYQVASQCDEIVMADLGGLDLSSLSMSVLFFKDALDLLGVRMSVVRCGDFKGAVEPYTLPRMSDPLRDHYMAMVRQMNQELVQRVVRGRGLDGALVRRMNAKRMFTASMAKKSGLVDRLVPWQGARAAFVQVRGNEDFELVNGLEEKKKKSISLNPLTLLANLVRPKKEEEVESATVAVLHLSGGIIDGTEPSPGSIVSGPTVKLVESLAENDEVKAVVVRINSPGGSATASEAILLALTELAREKPVVCSMGSVAASGGYYVTCFGRPILAEAGTITGSIGVFGMKPDLGALMRRVGLHEETIALDTSAGMDSLGGGWTEEFQGAMQAVVNEIYDRFIDHVARSRSLDRDRVLEMAGGRVWSGEQAKANGLVDRIGGLWDAIALVREEARLKDGFDVVHMPSPRSFMESIAQSLVGTRLMGGLDHALFRRLAETTLPRTLLWDALMNDGPARVWAAMPAELRLR
ncbi:MAG: signal peptide peptidase SppA [Planctomycetota bacterium]|nr:signal peptide peptidase SppA [Planctomycetota bacterium]